MRGDSARRWSLGKGRPGDRLPMTSGGMLFAGVAAGFAMGLISIAVGALVALPIGARRPHLVTSLPRGVSPTLVATCLVHLLLGFWTVLLGPTLAIVYARIFIVRWPGFGLGSPNLAFTLAMLVLAPLVGLTVLAATRSAVVEATLLAIAFAVVFGWLLPLLMR